MTTATHFTMICECFRCSGFKRAFSTFGHVNSGLCLRCNGSLRDIVTKPIERLAEYVPSARAESIATIAKVIGLVGEKRVKGADGRYPSAWGFSYWHKGDNERVFAAALTIAPEDVRRRGWAAFVAKVAATMPEKGDAPANYIARLVSQFSGVPADDVRGWLGEAAEAVAA